jgi:hypothetical protein
MSQWALSDSEALVNLNQVESMRTIRLGQDKFRLEVTMPSGATHIVGKVFPSMEALQEFRARFSGIKVGVFGER